MSAYQKNLLPITRKTKLALGQIKLDEPTPTDIICWEVTDNIMGILTNGERTELKATPEAITKELEKGKLLLFLQEHIKWNSYYNEFRPDDDHWFVVIGDIDGGGQAHIIEHLQGTCGGVHHSGTIKEIVKNLFDIQNGLVPDRFYHQTGPHVYNSVKSYDRKPLSVKSVEDYLTKI